MLSNASSFDYPLFIVDVIAPCPVVPIRLQPCPYSPISTYYLRLSILLSPNCHVFLLHIVFYVCASPTSAINSMNATDEDES